MNAKAIFWVMVAVNVFAVALTGYFFVAMLLIGNYGLALFEALLLGLNLSSSYRIYRAIRG